MKKISNLYKIALTALAILIVILVFTGKIDNLSQNYTQAAFDRALLSFGVARAINGVISVAQGTEVAVHPAGFGVNFTPGEILDPVNDLIERFSWIMLAATASLGIQQVFINISSSMLASILLSSLLIIVQIGLWKKNVYPQGVQGIFFNLLLIMLFIRFAIPCTAIASEIMYDYFLADKFEYSAAELKKTRDSISSINAATQNIESQAENKGIVDKMLDMYSNAAANIDINQKIDDYKNAVANASQNAINLIVVFTIQTICFPLLFLWSIYRILIEAKARLLRMSLGA